MLHTDGENLKRWAEGGNTFPELIEEQKIYTAHVKAIIRLYIVTMPNGDQYGVPAEVIADNYAKYYESRGESYQENFDAMIHWFDTNDFEFADWAKNNMDWSDVKDKAVLVGSVKEEPDFEDGWVNGEYEYRKVEE